MTTLGFWLFLVLWTSEASEESPLNGCTPTKPFRLTSAECVDFYEGCNKSPNSCQQILNVCSQCPRNVSIEAKSMDLIHSEIRKLKSVNGSILRLSNEQQKLSGNIKGVNGSVMKVSNDQQKLSEDIKALTNSSSTFGIVIVVLVGLIIVLLVVVLVLLAILLSIHKDGIRLMKWFRQLCNKDNKKGRSHPRDTELQNKPGNNGESQNDADAPLLPEDAPGTSNGTLGKDQQRPGQSHVTDIGVAELIQKISELETKLLDNMNGKISGLETKLLGNMNGKISGLETKLLGNMNVVNESVKKISDGLLDLSQYIKEEKGPINTADTETHGKPENFNGQTS